mgnify:CR=1 FL=1
MGVKVRERNGGWWVFIDHKGRRRRPSGARARRPPRSRRTRSTPRSGSARWACLDADKPARVVTFKEYAEHWMETVGSVRLRPATVEQYQVRLRLRLLPTLGPLPMTSITRETVRTLLGEMVKAGNQRSKGRPAARGTIQRRARHPERHLHHRRGGRLDRS